MREGNSFISESYSFNMGITIEDLKSISYNFEFFERSFNTSSKRKRKNRGSICSAKFALFKYSERASNSGEWILVRVNEDRIDVVYKNGGRAGTPTDVTELPADATKEKIEKAIEEYV